MSFSKVYVGQTEITKICTAQKVYYQRAEIEPTTWVRCPQIFEGRRYPYFEGDCVFNAGERIYHVDSRSSYYAVLDQASNAFVKLEWDTAFMKQALWKNVDGTVYGSNWEVQKVLDMTTNTWSNMTWTGLTNFYGSYVWEYNGVIYYSDSAESNQKRLNGTNWESIGWSGFTPQYGYNIWKDTNGVAYYSDGTTQKVLTESNGVLKWVTKTWGGLTNFYAYGVWKYGENVYYSSGGQHYVLNGGTWVTKTWNKGDISGDNMWVDYDGVLHCTGNNRYNYVFDSANDTWLDANIRTELNLGSKNGLFNEGDNYFFVEINGAFMLDNSTNLWHSVTMTGLPSYPYDGNIWSDGENVYYSNGSGQQLKKTPGELTWRAMSWSGFSNIYGSSVWKDGETIYYSSGGTDQYVLDKSTHTWTAVAWSGLRKPNGLYMWSDGTDVYNSYGTAHYRLDRSVNTWVTKNWTGLENFYGSNVWKVGSFIYYNAAGVSKKLDKINSSWSDKTWQGLAGLGQVWYIGRDIYTPNGLALTTATTYKLVRN